MNTARISVTIAGYGQIDVTSLDLDRAIARYLPASPSSLRALCQERSGLAEGFTDLNDVSAFLLVLADWDQDPGPASDPTRPRFADQTFEDC